MNFILAVLVWLVISLLLGVGIWFVAAKATWWVLGVVVAGFVAFAGKVGYCGH